VELYRKTKKNFQVPMIGLPPHQTWGGWVPPTPRSVGAMGTPRDKSGKFLIISSIQAVYADYSATNVISTEEAVAAVTSLPCHSLSLNSPPTVHRGSHKRV